MIIDFLDNILAKTAMAAGEAIDSLDKRTNNKDDEELKNLLNQADSSDLSILVDHITDNGKGRSSLSSESCKRLISAKNNNDFTSDIKHLIYREIGLFGGNTLMNTVRVGAGVPYKEILCDVAKHLKVSFDKQSSTRDIEIDILYSILEKSVLEMSETEKQELLSQFSPTNAGKYASASGQVTMAALQIAIKKSGFAAYKLAAIVANSISKAILGRGLTFAATGTMMKTISAFAGPIGWTITGLWTLKDLSNPAYMVTIPCVIQIAFMRQKMLAKSLESGSETKFDTADNNKFMNSLHDLF